MESAKAPESSSAVTEKTIHLPAPKVFFSKSKSQTSASAASDLDSQPHMSASGTTQVLKPGDESGKLCVGSSVMVGGVKEGVLRFIGRVHFMEGDWCGVELAEPEGLHDGTVEQVRYFTCKSGHGIFAPRCKVSLMPDHKSLDHQKSILWQQARSGGDAESQFQCEHAGSPENVIGSSVGSEQVQVREKSGKPSKLARPRSVVSSMDIDLKEASVQSKLPRPKSAVVSLAHADSNSDADLRVHRSSLMDYASLAKQQRASPKRVTFDDRLEYDLLSSSHISAAKLRKSNLQGEGYTSDEGSYDSAAHHARFDPYLALTLTYDLESSPPRKNTKAFMKAEGVKKPVEEIKITTTGENQQLDSIQSSLEGEGSGGIDSAGDIGDSNQGSTEQLLRDIFDRMEEEISNIPTPDTAEIQMIIPDSLSSSEEDARRIFSTDGRSRAISLRHRTQTRLDPDPHGLSKYSVTENDERLGEARGGKLVIDDSHERNQCSEELGLNMGAAPVTSGNMGGELQALTKKASFELARTALAQYADLIRAAQEDRTHRLAKASVKPKQQSCSVFDPSLEEPPTAEPLLEDSSDSLQGDFFGPSWPKDRTDRVKTFEDVGLSDSADSLNVELNESLLSVNRDGLDEYETFEGEDLRTINADDVIVDSDEEFIEGERLVISGELDLEDSLIIDSQPLINDPSSFQRPAETVSEGYQDVDGNLDDPASSAPVRPEIIGQISAEDWNNTINNMRQYESEASTLVPLVLRRRKQQSRPVSMVSTASSDAGIVDDLLPGYGLKHERPISLISSTSSTDTGCAMEVDSDMLSSAMMSSTLDDLVESWQEPSSDNTTAFWLKSHVEPELQEKPGVEESLDYLPADEKFCITDVDSKVINVENDGFEREVLCGEMLLVGTGSDGVKTKVHAREIGMAMTAEDKSNEKVDSVLLKLDSNYIQKNLSTDVAQKLSSPNPISVQVDNYSKDWVNIAEEQPGEGLSSEIQRNLCSGLEPVLAKVLVISSETPESRLVSDTDLQVYMVSEESVFSSEGACTGGKGSSMDEVQLENKQTDIRKTEHTDAKKTEPEHQATSTGASRMEDKCEEKKSERENMGATVKESQMNLLVETAVNSAETNLDETFSSRDETFQEDAAKTSSDEKNDQEEAQAGQKMSTGRGKDISCLEKEPELPHERLIEGEYQEITVAVVQEPHSVNSLQKFEQEDRGDSMKEDVGSLGRRKEGADGSDGLYQEVLTSQEKMSDVSDSNSNSCISKVSTDMGAMQPDITLDSSTIAAIGMASNIKSLAGAAESTKAVSEVVENAVISELVKISDAIEMATTDGSENVTGKAEISKIVLGLVTESDTVSGSAQDSDALLQLAESSGTASETSDGATVERLLEQVRDTEGGVSSDVRQQTKTAIQNDEARSLSDGHENGRQAVKTDLEKVILEPDRNEERNEIAGISKEVANDATGDSEVTGKVAVNAEEQRVPEKDATDGGNVSNGMRNGQAKAPSKLMARGNVRGEDKTKLGRADGSGDIKGSSVVGNEKTRQKALNVGKKTQVDSKSIVGKAETLSGNTKLEKSPSDVDRVINSESSAQNGNARRRPPSSSRNVKSDSANTKNVADIAKISRSQSNVDRSTKNYADSMAGSVRTRLTEVVKNQNKEPHPESPRDLKGNGRKKSASVSEPFESSICKDSGAENGETSKDKRSGNSAKLSILPRTSAAKVSGAKDGAKSKQVNTSASTSRIFHGKGKVLNGGVTKDAKPNKVAIGELNTAVPAKVSGVSPTSSSSGLVGSESQSSHETFVDAKAEGTQENVRTGIGQKNSSLRPGNTSAVQKRGSSNPSSIGRGRPSSSTTFVNAVPGKKASVPMMSGKESTTQVDQVSNVSTPRASLQQSTKAVTQGRKPSGVTQESTTSVPANQKRIPKPRSAAGHNDGNKTMSKRETKESDAAKPSIKKPSAAIAKDAKSKADSSSQLTSQVNELKSQLKQAQQQLDGVVKEREELQLKVTQIKEEQASEIRGIRQKHQQEIDSLKKAFVGQTKTEIEKVIDQHSHEVRTLKSYHDRHLSEAKQEHRVALEAGEKEFQDAIAKLKAEHLQELNETKASHEQQLNEISERFEEIKISLSSKVEQLRSRCDELCSRELCYKDTCKRETDLREQAALEVDSLRVVLEQRNGEIKKLRQQNALLDEKVQEIPVLKERITKLQQSIENLEAVNDLKSGHEKQLADMHQVLLRKFERESKAMKRLSMENEELMWRLSQSDFGPSCLQEKFPPGSSGVSLMSRSYDSQQAATMTHRTRSNADANQEATMSRSYDGFSDYYTSTPKAVSSQESGAQSARSSSSSSGSSHSQRVKLRRSGTYEVMDQENFEHKP